MLLKKESLSLPLTDSELVSYIKVICDQIHPSPKKVLIVPPDFTRFHSQAGKITQILYNILRISAEVNILPALGTHQPLTPEQREKMFGIIPEKLFLEHNWRLDGVNLGTIPESIVEEVSDARVSFPIQIELNKHLLNNSYDQIISIGQVVPHEVAGMANGSKNLLVGLGGKDFIDKTHFLSAVCGYEKRILGRINNPVRRIFNYGEEKFLSELPIVYFLTVIDNSSPSYDIKGLFIGKGINPFLSAAKFSQKHNITYLDQELEKIIVYLDPLEYKSTWLGNKAIYRSRLAIKDEGELIIIAPGVKAFGEDPVIDSIIRKYGYLNTDAILAKATTKNDLKSNYSAIAHLIHGSSEGRFKIVYSTKFLTKSEIESVNYNFDSLNRIEELYNPTKLTDGLNILNSGEEVFYIRNPGLGLWAAKSRLNITDKEV